MVFLFWKITEPWNSNLKLFFGKVEKLGGQSMGQNNGKSDIFVWFHGL